jgi:hypothetical protein
MKKRAKKLVLAKETLVNLGNVRGALELKDPDYRITRDSCNASDCGYCPEPTPSQDGPTCVIGICIPL